MPKPSLAALFTGSDKPLEIQSYPLPELKPGEVLIRITCCTICGSDLHTYEGRRSTPLPTILGHEILGEVVGFPDAPPRDVTGDTLAIGDRVTWSIAASCNQCFYCTHGLPAKCEQLFKYGHEAIIHGKLATVADGHRQDTFEARAGRGGICIPQGQGPGVHQS